MLSTFDSETRPIRQTPSSGSARTSACAPHRCSRLQPAFPVTRLATIVGDSEHSDRGFGLEVDVDDMVREALHRCAPHTQLGGHARHEHTCTWEANDMGQGGVYRVEELGAQSGSLVVVPAGGSAVFLFCLVFKPDGAAHRRRNSSSARRLTSSQGVPADWPERIRRARRSISAAQAVSTSCMSLSASSRLASNSAATSARSSAGSVRASRRSCCVREVIAAF